MECPRRWTAVSVLLYLLINGGNVSGQNTVPGIVPKSGQAVGDGNREYNQAIINPSSSTSQQLINSLLNMAAANGALPDILPLLQPVEKQQLIQNNAQKPLSLIPLMPVAGSMCPQEPIIVTGQPVSASPSPNVLITSPVTPAPTFASCMAPTIQPALSGIQQTAYIPQMYQTVPANSYCPYGISNVGVVRPLPVMVPQQPNEICSSFESIILPEANPLPLNLPISPPSPELPIINTASGTFEVSNQPMILTSDDQPFPVNLQINVPSTSAPSPRITVVSASPSNAPAPQFNDAPPFFPYPPPMPMMIGGSGSRSGLRDLLPILLVALFADRGGYGGGGGGCCCCCPCNCGNSETIPIPYPIPIPVNNPIITTDRYPYSPSSECGINDANE